MKKIICILVAISMLFAVGCAKKNDIKTEITTETENENTQKTEKEDTKEKTMSLTLYFPDSNAMGLKKEVREVSGNFTSEAEAVVSELIKGTDKKGLMSIVPENTKINKVSVSDGMCTVNLSGEFLNAAGSSTMDTLCIYSVVNSLCEIDGIEYVMFLIDGETVEAFGGFIFNEPFEADESFNK